MSERSASGQEPPTLESGGAWDEAQSPLFGSHHAQGAVKSIQRFHELFQSGVITEEEFSAAKARILCLEARRSSGSVSLESHRSGRHRRRGKRSRESNDSRGSTGSTYREERGKSRSRSRSRSRSSRSSRSSSSSSSSSASSSFMIAPRAKVWNLLASGSDTDNANSAERGAGGKEIPGGLLLPVMEKERLPAVVVHAPAGETLPSSPPSMAQQRRYGTFQPQWVVQHPQRQRSRVPLRPACEVRVEYFNCLGARGDRFSDVKLREEEMRPPFFLRRRTSHPLGAPGVRTSQSEPDFSTGVGEEWKAEGRLVGLEHVDESKS
ncbi:cation transporter [Trypanosoma conorhini]|uniref:Cation transporter n=1 Tax=Trypanosoma conorhini TaxID=83891 RepID=A0A3R7K6S0_9TRYP|nr:cation transporter [Trypanosoma conorhini]RNF02671.1 cation transporter [Trypanosoma conorhini]